MPGFLPENNAPRSTDNELRALEKWAGLLFIAKGNIGSLTFPEGSKPLPGDNEERLAQKINAMS